MSSPEEDTDMFKDASTESEDTLDTGGDGSFIPPPGSEPIDGAPGQQEPITELDGGAVAGKEPGKDEPSKEAAKPAEDKDKKPEKPATGPSGPKLGLIWKIFAGFAFVSICFIGSIFMQTKFGFGAQVGSDQLKMIYTPSESNDGLKSVLGFVSMAKKEIFIVAREANSVDLLDALAAQQKKGVMVVVLLDRELNTSSSNKSPLAYLKLKGVPESNLFSSAQPLLSQYIIVDREHVWLGTMPFNSKGQRAASEVIYLKSPALGQNMYQRTLGLIRAAKGQE